MAVKRLQKEFKDLLTNQYNEFSCSPSNDNLFEWDGIIFGPDDTIYEGGLFKFKMTFKNNYPMTPPSFMFVSKMYHPNIYSDGKPCISILNEGEDFTGYESANERWNGAQGISTIIMSIINLLNEPNLESPANIDAGKLYRDNYEEFKKEVYNTVIMSDK